MTYYPETVTEWQPMPTHWSSMGKPVLMWNRETGEVLQDTSPSPTRARMFIRDGFLWWTPAPTLPKGTSE